jgi:hypothetical protein
MKRTYETLDACLDHPDAIRAKIAQKTRRMTAKEVRAYFARSAKRLHDLTGLKLRVRRGDRRRRF